jgi:hypothetical protein
MTSVISGPYASAILRFQIRFPPSYPDLPPLVKFNTDIFHPLLVPLTTYTFTTGSSDTDTVSATDEERLPPGGFSLRHGFPHWFGRARRSAANSAASSRNVSGSAPENARPPTLDDEVDKLNIGRPKSPAPGTSLGEHDLSPRGPGPMPPASETNVRGSPIPSDLPYRNTRIDVPVMALLEYIRSTFNDESVLDSIPLEAAGNPGAWHAWRSHRRGASEAANTSQHKDAENKAVALGLNSTLRKDNLQTRAPGEWNWEGVWAKRVQNGIETSYLESVLFGNVGRGGTDDMVSRDPRLRLGSRVLLVLS